MPRTRTIIPGVDKKLLIKDAAKLLPDPTRRLLLRGGLSLGALAVLGGCDIVDSDAAEGVLRKISKFNDRAQAWLFNPNTLAPEYPESKITRPFPFNALVYLDLSICEAPLQESESAPARLAPEGINVKEAYQTFRTEPTDSFNVFTGAPWTNRLRHLNVSLAWCSRVRCVSGPWSDSRISSAFKTVMVCS